jgi:regulation of enolase protein 1 (concanavalin A-like superfamily)
MENLLANLTSDNIASRSLAWEHAPLDWQPLPEGGIRVTVPAKADYFRDPSGAVVNDNAPFLWTTASGDFVARALVEPHFASTYDSGVLMVRHDERNWAKICFEKTDFGTIAAVSVVTREFSDDANGVDLTVKRLWLQMARAGNVFALHYSTDGEQWRMVRLFRLDVPTKVRVGVVAQCPSGPGATIDLLHFSVEQRPVKNIRAGN